MQAVTLKSNDGDTIMAKISSYSSRPFLVWAVRTTPALRLMDYLNKIPHQRKSQVPVEDHFIMVDISSEEAPLRKFAYNRDILRRIQCVQGKVQTMYACQVWMISNFNLQRLHVSSRARIGYSIAAERGPLYLRMVRTFSCLFGCLIVCL